MFVLPSPRGAAFALGRVHLLAPCRKDLAFRVGSLRPLHGQHAAFTVKRYHDGGLPAAIAHDADPGDACRGVELGVLQRGPPADRELVPPDRDYLRINRFARLAVAASEKSLETILVASPERRGDVGVALVVVPFVSAAMVPCVVAADDDLEHIAFAIYKKPAFGVSKRDSLVARLKGEVPPDDTARAGRGTTCVRKAAEGEERAGEHGYC